MSDIPKELLTAGEAARFLRLDLSENCDTDITLRYYRNHGLVGIRVGRKIRYRLDDLRVFLEKKSKDIRLKKPSISKG